MPTYAEAVKMMQSADSGYLAYMVMAFVATLSLYWLTARHPRLARLYWYVPVLLIAVSALYSPLAAALGAVALCGLMFYQGGLKWPLAATLGLALLLRLPLLGQSLWYDEAFTARLIGLPLDALPGTIMADVHPPLYYLLMWPLAQITSAPALLRLPSLAAGLLSVVLAHRLTLALGHSAGAARITALLFAVLPASVYYSTELRSYEFMVVIVLYLVLTIVQNQPRRFAVALAALFWIHNVGYLYGAVIGALGVAYWYRRNGRAWLGAVGAAGAVGALWLPFFVQQAANVQGGHWTYFSFGGAFWPLVSMTMGNISSDNIIPVVSVVAGLTIISLLTAHEWALFTGRGLLWLLICFGVPALAIVASAVWRPMFVWRHYLPAMLLMVIIWSVTLNRSRLARAIFAPVLALAIVNLYNNPRPDYRAWLADACQGATAAYATSINAAFVLSENTPYPVTVWPGAVDSGQTVEPSSLPAFGYATGPLPGGDVCLMLTDIPATRQEERDHVASVLAQHTYEVTVQHVTVWQVYYIYKLEVSPRRTGRGLTDIKNVNATCICRTLYLPSPDGKSTLLHKWW